MTTTWKTLKAYGILKAVPRRGCKAGRNKQRNIQVIQGYGKYRASSNEMGFIRKYSIFENYSKWPYMQIYPNSLMHGLRRNNTYSELDCLVSGLLVKRTLNNIKTTSGTIDSDLIGIPHYNLHRLDRVMGVMAAFVHMFLIIFLTNPLLTYKIHRLNVCGYG